MALPSPASKANCDSSTDDPKLAILTDLAGLIDKFNLLLGEVQPVNARLTTLSGITAQQATDLAAVSTFIGTLLNDSNQATALTTLGALLRATSAKAAAYTVVAADRGALIDYTSGSYTLSLTAAATLGAGFAFGVRNSGSGTITIDPNSTEQIDGAATITLGAGESCLVVCDGSAFKTVSGRVKMANATEAAAGTDGTLALSPLRLRDALAATGSAPIYACRAWVNFKGTGPVAIRASGNVSSITHNGTGDYTVNFTTAMPDANYSVSSWCGASTVTGTLSGYFVSAAEATNTRTTSSIRLGTWSVGAGTLQDLEQVNIAIFR